VDAFDDPHVESDLAIYRAHYGLPPCTTANGCFRRVDQTGGSTHPFAEPGWGVEISLDVDMVSAICPRCHILLVEAQDPTFESFAVAENEAVQLGAIGKALAAAKRAIGKAHCGVGKVRRAYSTRLAAGRVLSQSPRHGRRLVYGAKVSLVVSRGRRA
jgi:hypothetical protein